MSRTQITRNFVRRTYVTRNFVTRNFGVNSYNPSTQAYFDQLSTQPDLNIKSFYNNRIGQSVASGNFAKMDRWFVLGAQYEDNAKVSIVNPTSTNLVKISTPNWTQYQGYTSATGKCINSKFTPATDSINYTQNSACFWFYIRTQSAIEAYCGGCADGVAANNEMSMIVRNASDLLKGWINNADASDIAVSQTSSLGLFSLVRMTSTQIAVYWNGVNIGSTSISSQGLSINEFYVGALNYNGSMFNPSGRQCFAFGIGSGTMDQVALYSEINGLATDFGVNV